MLSGVGFPGRKSHEAPVTERPHSDSWASEWVRVACGKTKPAGTRLLWLRVWCSSCHGMARRPLTVDVSMCLDTLLPKSRP